MGKSKPWQALAHQLADLHISWNQRCMDPTGDPPCDAEKADHQAHIALLRTAIADARGEQS